MVLELDSLNHYINKLRPLPWRQVVMVIVGSFLTASILSSILGWMLMGTMTHKSVVDSELDVPVEFGQNLGVGKAAVEKILERNIFNSEGLMGDVDPDASGTQITKTQLPVKVLGIIYGGNPFNGIAMVEDTQQKTVNSLMINERLNHEAKVIEIQRDRIIIDHKGRKEFAPLEEVEIRRSSRAGGGKRKPTTAESLTGSGYATDAPPENFKEDGFERKGTNIELTAEYKNRLLGPDLANLLQDAKASPNLVDGMLKGWRMDRIRKNSFFEKAGMMNGDVVEEINGVLLSDAAQSIKQMQAVRNEGAFDIKINRNGQKLILNMKVR
jgi:type II secretion system protein C